MNQYPYIDPGDTGGPLAPFGMTEPPPYDASKELREGDWTHEGLLKELAKLLAPNITSYDRPPLESAMLDAGQFLNAPERGAMAASKALGPLAAGMIRWSKNEARPNAMLHRGLSNPQELDFWSRIFQRGQSSQAPTSVVTPSVLQTFQSKPYGLLFDINEPAQIKTAGVNDLWSKMRPSKDTEATGRRYANAYDKLTTRGTPDEALSRLAAKWDQNYAEGPREWQVNPSSDWIIDPNKAGLDDLLGNMLENIWDLEPKGKQLLHSEVIPQIDRSMLAGVRLPLHQRLRTPREQAVDDLFPLMFEKDSISDKGNPDLIRALTQFAEQQNVPIYRWPAVETIDQEIKGLSGDPFRGKWGWKPGSREYKTSSQLPEIFGIRDLP